MSIPPQVKELELRSAIKSAALPRHAFTSDFQEIDATIIFADLRGFTAVFNEHSTFVVIEMLNRFLGAMCEIVLKNGGMVDKFIGDSVMATFGTPQPKPDDIQRALACAVEMQLAMDALNAFNHKLKLPNIYMGIGINTGQVVAGHFGSAARSEYTVIGDSVNLASRIESFSLRGQILMGEATYHRVAGYVEVNPPVDVCVKGKSDPIAVYDLLAIPSLNLRVPNRESRRSPRVKVCMPFTYQFIDRKIVSEELCQGTVLDVSYYGLLVVLQKQLKVSEEIKLSLDLPILGCKACSIYAKVVTSEPSNEGFRVTLEFTSISQAEESMIKYFVQMLIQS